ncbi:MAG: ArsR family transcriptional regulator [Anaerolineae bacterium CG_4_9_14_3_um_filter_57_17]|nr:metalloregulator ArsR/SmtB family transcription factor [bacterium]NCT21026.1 metalloregulator ArsR/SmtB family transcription factor [bacterium]OIO83311.1 MAG: ArsR family transcriptional regulator [Anaerolineae bacterium CG2_30_57_67]PJB67849.1 MAG: ArsR family transcriptional regulator [Anaerolineae bacterium CG_4_9_14_3_um_filter_57_17]
MNSEDTTDELVTLFKALADSNRLKIIGLLAQKAYSVEELAALLELKAPTVSHHLGKLVKTGLISARAEGYYSVYHLDQQALEALSRRILSPAQMSAAADGVDVNAYDHKVVRVFSLPDGRLKTIPAQRKKLEAILRHVVQTFDAGTRYSEKQVNEILARFHEDTASLRRELVGSGLMAREGGSGAYWRI